MLLLHIGKHVAVIVVNDTGHIDRIEAELEEKHRQEMAAIRQQVLKR